MAKRRTAEQIIEKEIKLGKKEIGWENLSLWLKGGIIGIIVGCIIAIIRGFWWLILFFVIGTFLGWLIDKLELSKNRKIKQRFKNKQKNKLKYRKS